MAASQAEMKSFYRLRVERSSCREFWWGVKSPVILLLLLLKWLRVPIPGSSDDPPVETLTPFEVDEASVPEEMRERFRPLIRELEHLGFHSPVYHAIRMDFIQTTIYWATFCHRSGRACARIHYRLWTVPRPQREYLFPVFITGFEDGGYLVTSAGKPDMVGPRHFRVRYQRGATAAELWHTHENALHEQAERTAVPVMTPNELRSFIESHHAALRDFHLARGVFERFPPSLGMEAGAEAPSTDAAAVPMEHLDVLAEIDRIQNKKSGWLSGLAILLVSVLIFAGVGAGGLKGAAREFWSWKMLAMAVPILLFHELGHLVAMRWFRYRNLRMFFIPLLGAAVTGRNYNVPGWKKAVVALMGPVPGILVGAAAGCAGLALHRPWLVNAALFALILNAFNLLPFLPLDGGRVLQATLFCRHPLLDVGFQLLPILALVGFAVVSGDQVIGYVAVAMLIALPTLYRTSKVADRLRAGGVAPPSSSEQGLPLTLAVQIIDEVKKSFSRKLGARNTAAITLNVFENFNARPPGWFGTLALLGVHGASVAVAAIFAMILVVAPRLSFPQATDLLAARPKDPYHRGSILEWPAGPQPELPPARATVVANLPDRARAETVFYQWTARVPPTARVKLFGRTLLVSFPSTEGKHPQEDVNQLRRETSEVSVDQGQQHVLCRLFAIAPSAAEARALQAELGTYFICNRCGAVLIPPWSPLWEQSPQRPHWLRSRQTYERLAKGPTAEFKLIRSREEREVAKAIQEALEDGHQPDQSLNQKLRRLRREAERRHYEAMRAEGPDRVDLPMVEGYIAWEKAFRAPRTKGKPPLVFPKVLSQRMGILPGSESMSSHGSPWGMVQQSDRYLLITLTPRRIESDLPALAEWLYAQGCGAVTYECIVGKDARQADGTDED